MTPNDPNDSCVDYGGSWVVHTVESAALVVNCTSLLMNLLLLYSLVSTPSFHVHLRGALASVALGNCLYFVANLAQHGLNVGSYFANYDSRDRCPSLGEFSIVWTL